MLVTSETCRRQQRSAYDYLVEAMKAVASGVRSRHPAEEVAGHRAPPGFQPSARAGIALESPISSDERGQSTNRFDHTIRARRFSVKNRKLGLTPAAAGAAKPQWLLRL